MTLAALSFAGLLAKAHLTDNEILYHIDSLVSASKAAWVAGMMTYDSTVDADTLYGYCTFTDEQLAKRVLQIQKMTNNELKASEDIATAVSTLCGDNFYALPKRSNDSGKEETGT